MHSVPFLQAGYNGGGSFVRRHLLGHLIPKATLASAARFDMEPREGRPKKDLSPHNT